MAEGVGFEPTEESPPHTLSRRAESTALASLREKTVLNKYCHGSHREFNYNTGNQPWQEQNMAERVGFEPTRRVNTYRFSRAAPSTSRTSLLVLAIILCSAFFFNKTLFRLCHLALSKQSLSL